VIRHHWLNKKEYPQITQITQNQGQEQRAGAGIIGQLSLDIYQL